MVGLKKYLNNLRASMPDAAGMSDERLAGLLNMLDPGTLPPDARGAAEYRVRSILGDDADLNQLRGEYRQLLDQVGGDPVAAARMLRQSQDTSFTNPDVLGDEESIIGMLPEGDDNVLADLPQDSSPAAELARGQADGPGQTIVVDEPMVDGPDGLDMTTEDIIRLDDENAAYRAAGGGQITSDPELDQMRLKGNPDEATAFDRLPTEDQDAVVRMTGAEPSFLRTWTDQQIADTMEVNFGMQPGDPGFVPIGQAGTIPPAAPSKPFAMPGTIDPATGRPAAGSPLEIPDNSLATTSPTFNDGGSAETFGLEAQPARGFTLGEIDDDLDLDLDPGGMRQGVPPGMPLFNEGKQPIFPAQRQQQQAPPAAAVEPEPVSAVEPEPTLLPEQQPQRFVPEEGPVEAGPASQMPAAMPQPAPLPAAGQAPPLIASEGPAAFAGSSAPPLGEGLPGGGVSVEATPVLDSLLDENGVTPQTVAPMPGTPVISSQTAPNPPGPPPDPAPTDTKPYLTPVQNANKAMYGSYGETQPVRTIRGLTGLAAKPLDYAYNHPIKSALYGGLAGMTKFGLPLLMEQGPDSGLMPADEAEMETLRSATSDADRRFAEFFGSGDPAGMQKMLAEEKAKQEAANTNNAKQAQ